MANVQNLASGTLVGSISASTTSLSVYVGEGSSFVIETVWPATPFYATIMPAVPNAGVANSLDSEIVEVTAVSNLNGNTILTVNRGQRGTSGKAFSDGDIVTAAIYTEDIGSASPGKGCPIGTILPYSSTTIPEGYLVCDGSAVSRTTYADLFDVIGTTYGTGDGSTTFNLPNLKGKVPVGQDTSDTSFDVLGETGGEKTHKLVNNELPKIDAYWQFHGAEHGTNVYNLKGSNSIGTRINGKYQAISGASGAYSYSDVGIRFGNNGAHNNLQPYTVLVYIIKYKDLAGTVAEVKNEYTESTDDVYSASYINSAVNAFHSGNYANFNFGAFTVTNQERVLGTHTCTVAGTYLIIMSLSFDLSGGGYVVRKCYKNNTMVAADTPNIINQTSSSRMGGTFATVQTLAVGDVVKMTYQGYTSGSGVASNKPNNGWAMIRII